MVILYSLIPAAISANEGLLRTSRNLTSTPLIRNLSCRNISTWRRPIISTTRLPAMHSRRVTNPGLGSGPAASSVATSLVLVPQLIRQLRRLGVESVTQQRLYVGSIRIRVGRRGHERAVQGEVDLAEQRLQPVVHRSHGFARVDIITVGSRHLHLHV